MDNDTDNKIRIEYDAIVTVEIATEDYKSQAEAYRKFKQKLRSSFCDMNDAMITGITKA